MRTPEERAGDFLTEFWPDELSTYLFDKGGAAPSLAAMFREYGAEVAAEQRQACADAGSEARSRFGRGLVANGCAEVVAAVLSTPLVGETGAQK